MGHYDLNRMGWQQFEHMIQALATDEIGSGVKSFGSGKDGQRDATFRGKVDFPKGAGDTWDGYGVIQVKHRETPAGTTADWKWFLDEVKNELRGWNSKKSFGMETPEYLLFATNIRLSGTASTGGKDQFEDLLQSTAPALGLKGWFAWDYDRIRTLLDTHTEVRQRYLELIVVGDFLVQLASLLPSRTALTAEAAASHAVGELTSRQWVRTGDAGYGDNSKVRLADIAIDLPCVRDDHPAVLGQRQSTVQTVMRLGNNDHSNTGRSGAPQGVVIVGGPGQGKSTLAQLIAHNYRVAFLKETDIGRYGSTAGDALSGLQARFVEAGIPEPVRRRWPIVVELAKAGAAIGKNDHGFSLLNYLAQTIVTKGEAADPSSLLDWLRSWPVCLVLDGLDEVPSARVRARLLESISILITELQSEGVDAFIVGTTRPQGYHGEFSETFRAVELELVELTEEEALNYSEALTNVRYLDDPQLAEQVTERLVSAVHERVTQRLMTTPLQVTIMTALAEESVELPSDRFELFDRYYRVVYSRELVKPEAPAVLKKLRPHIDYLHEHAGLKLQVRTERPGSSDATLPKRELARILRSRLIQKGFEPTDAEGISEELLRVSTERLVLLVLRRPTKFEFEVRSLQEYMAARALTEGDDSAVLAALKTTLPSNHWRNTWLLAAGKLLKWREHLTDQLIQMVTTFDSENAENAAARLGASLATDLYLDNYATEYPKARQTLLRSALTQLSDTSDVMPAPLSRLLDQISVEAESAIMLESLEAISQESLSSLAMKYVSEHTSGMSALAKQARSTLKDGRRYIRPRAQDAKTRSHILGELLSRSTSTSPALDRLVHCLKAETRAGLENGSIASVELLAALEDPMAREALVQAAPQFAVLNPDVSQHAVSLLRERAGRAIRGQDLEQDS